MFIFSRQARDKHWKNSRKKTRFCREGREGGGTHRHDLFAERERGGVASSANRQQPQLGRREPEREVAGVVLRQRTPPF